MSKIFALLAIILILTGIVVLAGPYVESEMATRSLAPETAPLTSIFTQLRQAAEAVQAPLSILFGVVSLYWNRKNYLRQQRARGASA
jgi:hypothetical protein